MAMAVAVATAQAVEHAVGTVAEPGSAGPLVVRIRNWLGDVVLGLPALHLLQAHGYTLKLVARGGWAPALLAGYDWAVAVQPAPLLDRVRQLRALRRACREQDPRFDRRHNALLLPQSLSSALEMRLAGLRAVGVANEGRSPLLARAVAPAHSGHESARYFALACSFLGVQAAHPPDIGMRIAPQARAAATRCLAGLGIHDRPYVLICPFARGLAATAKKSHKKWPGFPEFVARAPARLGVPLLVYPGPGEHAEGRAVYPAAQAIEAADLGLYLALMQRAALVVANDTGPGHMAAAMGAPVFSVLGPTIASRWAPWGRNVRVLQHAAPDAEDAVDAWPTVDEVLQAAAGVLAGRR